VLVRAQITNALSCENVVLSDIGHITALVGRNGVGKIKWCLTPFIGLHIGAALLLLGLASLAAQAQIGTPVDLGSNQAANPVLTALSVITSQAVPAAGSIIVIAAAGIGPLASPPATAVCSDSAGHVYNTDASALNPITDLTTICSTHGIAAQLPAGSTITVTWLGGASPWNERMHAFAVTGLASVPLDRTASATNFGVSPSPSSGQTAATTQANELLFGAITDDLHAASSAGFSPGTNGTSNNCAATGNPTYTAFAGVGTISPLLFGMYCTVSATGGYAAQGSFATSTSWEALVVTYKAATTVPGAPTIGTATAGNGQATIAFTPPASNGGSAITGYTATCGAFSATGAASPITVTGLTNGTTYTCSVTATSAVGTGPASATTSVTPSFNTFTTPSATGTGNITASIVGGGAACSFVTPQFIGPPPGAAPIPPTTPGSGIVFPQGLFDFRANGCTPGSTITLTITYPNSIAGATYWKYGPTAANPVAHWYVLPATLVGNTATFTITDGGLGDDDLAANGTIVDQGGPGFGPQAPIPTLSEWAMALMAGLLLMFGMGRLRRVRN
jgi:IPTL-CTERM motif/Fibronectin type III domain